MEPGGGSFREVSFQSWRRSCAAMPQPSASSPMRHPARTRRKMPTHATGLNASEHTRSVIHSPRVMGQVSRRSRGIFCTGSEESGNKMTRAKISRKNSALSGWSATNATKRRKFWPAMDRKDSTSRQEANPRAFRRPMLPNRAIPDPRRRRPPPIRGTAPPAFSAIRQYRNRARYCRD